MFVVTETHISPITVTARYTKCTFIYCRNTGKVGSNPTWCTDAYLYYFCLHWPVQEWTLGRAYPRPKVSYNMPTNKIMKPERGTRKLLSGFYLTGKRV